MSQDELEELLSNLTIGSISVGNGCDEDNYMTLTIEGDMDMNGNDLEILYAHITVTGKLLNEGTVTLLCDSAIFEVLDEETLGEEEENEPMVYKVYPNPAHEYVHVQGDGLKMVSINDMSGKALKQYALDSYKNKIYLYNLPAGTYILLIVDNQFRKSTFKLIKR